ncbi:MAG: RNA-guided endonuclease TnpB family protein [Acidimicrobiales bacterium]
MDRPSRHPAIPSHTGAKRFAWNFMLNVVEEQCRAREALRVLALRQGAGMEDAQAWAERMCAVPYLAELNEKRRKDHEAKVAAGQRTGSYHCVSEWCPWSAEAMRYLWNRMKDEVAPWWAENSKECYSSAFEALAAAFHDHFASRDGTRKGLHVGWPNHKRRRGRQSVSFTTGAVAVLDRHHVQLPVIGVLRVKEPTTKLRCKIEAGGARILRSTLTTEGAKTYVSFGVQATREEGVPSTAHVCGHDVGIAVLVTSSDASVIDNPKAEQQVRTQVSRYQRKMDRQHRTGSPRCFNSDDTHIAGACHWKDRSRRARKNQAKLKRAHARAARIRRDAIHKTSYRAATTNAVNIVEDLRVEQMGRKGRGKRGFNRASHDAALAELRRELSYKCSWYGSLLWLAGTWYPSSKTCSGCRVKKETLSRSTRVFHCEHCGLEIDRDLNAAKNLAALAELASVCLLAQLATGTPVDWSKLPIRPYGWEPDHNTRSSRGSARAGSRKADGGERKTARASRDGDCSFDREATEPPVLLVGAHQSEVA